MKPALKLSLLAFAFILGGFYTYKNILPYKFSSQHPLPQDNMTGMYDHSDEMGTFHGAQVASSDSYLANLPMNLDRKILGTNNEDKRIEIDLTNQKLYAFEGDIKVLDVLVSTGKWGKTPTGEFRIWTKLKSTKMSGGSKELHTYYYLPNVPFTMYFYNSEIPATRGYGIHGTYWHSNFGHPMSHGCINMKTEEAEKLFYWANPEIGNKSSVRATADNPGTKIVIYGTAPNN